MLDGERDTVLCEAPIEALTLRLQRPDSRILALGGNLLTPGDVANYILPEKDVFLAFDNDVAGETIAAKAWKIWPRAIRLMPVGKDFNQDLQDGKMILPGDEASVPLNGLFSAKPDKNPRTLPEELDHDDEGFKGPGG